MNHLGPEDNFCSTKMSCLSCFVSYVRLCHNESQGHNDDVDDVHALDNNHHYQDNRLLDAAPAPDVLALREDRDDVEEPRHRLEPEHSSL